LLAWERARSHFLPVLSTDLDLPEWVYRTEFSQEYFSVPPLAFILHYGATRFFDNIEPVLLGKLLAQFLICVSTIGAAFFLYGVFGVWPTLIGLSFLIWGVPFLLWFSNGYFAVNVGLAVQLVFVSWCCAVAARSSRDEDWSGASVVAINFIVGVALAFLGGFADYVPLAANAIAVVGLLGLAAIRWNRRPSARGPLVASAFGVLIGSLAAGLSTTVLYSRQMGFERYRRALTMRVAQRSGEGLLVEHFEVIRRQMLTAWPPEVLVALIAMLCMVLGWCLVSLVRRRDRPATDQALVILLALAVSVVPSFLFSLPGVELREYPLVVLGHVDNRLGHHALYLDVAGAPTGRIGPTLGASARGTPLLTDLRRVTRAGRRCERAFRPPAIGRRPSRRNGAPVPVAWQRVAARWVSAGRDRHHDCQARTVRGFPLHDRVSQAACAPA
jgi:hypothetical protein